MQPTGVRVTRPIKAIQFVALALALGLVMALVSEPRAETPYQRAFGWYEKAARAGDPEAQFLLGVRASEGAARRRDPAEARIWFARAAESGHARAQFRLATMLQNGEGGPRDITSAARLYARAGDQGVASAAYNRADMHLRGEPGPRDVAAAARWFRRALFGGIQAAAVDLSGLYWRGEGVRQDRVAAYVLLWGAARANVEGAEAGVLALEGELTEAERAEARRRTAGLID